MRFFELHKWEVSVGEAVEIQHSLKSRVSLEDGFLDLNLIAGVDMSISKASQQGHAAVVVLSFPDLNLVEVRQATRKLQFPYVPGFLSFRESPVILQAFLAIEHVPDVVIVDGQGIAHPRGFGIASHLGVLLDIPTIGCAKSYLYGVYEEPGLERGSSTPLFDLDGRQIGNVVRTRTGVKPVFVSPGHKISFDSAVKIVLDCAPQYRLPEPIRVAHRFAAEKAGVSTLAV
ncbi:MAG: deoxyribonuclease V [Armatimonadetes bacterium]|nr:deoxyribonuclease V [Armatimonadota bacterium]